MQILLLGQNSSITDTIEDMINYKEDWSFIKISSFKQADQWPKRNVDVIIINLVDFTAPSPQLIQSITQKSSTPILALHTYDSKPLIKPLIEAGAAGYLQLGTSEEQVHKAIKKVAAQENHISLM